MGHYLYTVATSLVCHDIKVSQCLYSRETQSQRTIYEMLLSWSGFGSIFFATFSLEMCVRLVNRHPVVLLYYCITISGMLLTTLWNRPRKSIPCCLSNQECQWIKWDAYKRTVWIASLEGYVLVVPQSKAVSLITMLYYNLSYLQILNSTTQLYLLNKLFWPHSGKVFLVFKWNNWQKRQSFKAQLNLMLMVSGSESG